MTVEKKPKAENANLSVVEQRMNQHMRSLMMNLTTSENPFMEDVESALAERKVYTGGVDHVASTTTGEYLGTRALFEYREMDEANFVKDFDREIDAAFELTPTAKRVLAHIRDEYRTSVKVRKNQALAGHADMLYLRFFDGGLCGKDIELSERTFKRGLKEIVAKNILAPYDQNTFWINPTVFFKGDRVRLVKEWRIKRTAKEVSAKLEGDGHLQMDIEDVTK